jgi:hypothetical protein
VGPRAGLITECRGKISCICRGSNPGRPPRSQTLYWLSYPGSLCVVQYRQLSLERGETNQLQRICGCTHLIKLQCTASGFNSLSRHWFVCVIKGHRGEAGNLGATHKQFELCRSLHASIRPPRLAFPKRTLIINKLHWVTKLIIAQLVNKLNVFYVKLRFVTVLYRLRTLVTIGVLLWSKPRVTTSAVWSGGSWECDRLCVHYWSSQLHVVMGMWQAMCALLELTAPCSHVNLTGVWCALLELIAPCSHVNVTGSVCTTGAHSSM